MLQKAYQAYHFGDYRPVASQLAQPSGNGGRFPKILNLFQGLTIGLPSGCKWETLIFKIIMIDDVSLWSFRIYMVGLSLLDFINSIS